MVGFDDPKGLFQPQRFRDPKAGGLSHPQPSSLPRKSSMPDLRSGQLMRRKWSWSFFLMWKFFCEAFLFTVKITEGKTAPFINYSPMLVLLWKNTEHSFGEEQSQVLSSNLVIFLKTFSEQTSGTNLTIMPDFDLSIPALLLCLFLWSYWLKTVRTPLLPFTEDLWVSTTPRKSVEYNSFVDTPQLQILRGNSEISLEQNVWRS